MEINYAITSTIQMGKKKSIINPPKISTYKAQLSTVNIQEEKVNLKKD